MRGCKIILVAMAISHTASKGAQVHIEPEGFSLALTPEECAFYLVEAKEGPSVAYQANIDEEGQALVPVDLDQGYKVPVPSHIFIPLKLPINERTPYFEGIPNDFLQDAYMGYVQVDLKDSKAWLNGKPLFSIEQETIKAHCRQNLKHD